ncbi:helix-turn-helix transcriptional regulator [Dactylosporangium sp. NPDC051541]|uniref:helix-turn-helix transcriptional regulator n=1 Tax=Dactylosporangium sp. NPDC051541 TaxID=3363977 RepID=UPI0037BC6A49
MPHPGTRPAAPDPVVRDITDADHGEAFLTAVYGSGVRMRVSGGPYRLRHVRRGPGPFHIDTMEHSASADLRVEPFGTISALRMRSGVRTDLRSGDRCGPGDLATLARPGEANHLRFDAVRFTAVLVPLSIAAAVARNRPDDDLGPLLFTGVRPARPDDARHWRQTVDYVTAILSTGPSPLAQPLLAGPTARLLAATLLATFPNTWTAPAADPPPYDRTDATPSTLSRAVTFVDANADLDISVADIARAAHVTVRAVQLAFRRHLELTPMAYLRQVRLARAHEQLRAADPDDGTTVAAVAARWGYVSASQFAALYRRTYGRLPSRTLRT